MSAKDSPSQLHKRLVMGLIDYMNKNDWQVVHAAGVSGYLEPFAIGGYTPDVIAKRSDGLIAVGEAETCERLGEEKTLRQFSAFSDLSTTQGKLGVPFFVVVPESCIDKLDEILNSKYASKMDRIMRVKMAGV
ncbi:MAG: hypothetical protein JRN09_01130 [Nitrososphaerota archaeon]|jgi:hypothetical protein|nr:hypothetical protein [Nitrososphaerota archaeon]